MIPMSKILVYIRSLSRSTLTELAAHCAKKNRSFAFFAASTSKLFSYMSVTAWIGVKYLFQSGGILLVIIFHLINITMTRSCGDFDFMLSWKEQYLDRCLPS